MSKPNQIVRFNLSRIPDAEKKGLLILGCRYDVIMRVAMEHNFTGKSEEDKWTLCWSDVPLPLEKINSLRSSQVLGGPNSPLIQKINHFPGMYEICRKDRLCRNLNRLKRTFPRDYKFFPPTWDLPADIAELLEYGKGRKNTTYIVKPDSGSQGKGIFLVKNLKMLCPFAQCVCQLYVTQPFLIDGYKFDQRLYVLITCVDPLRFYIHVEGLARFATVKYEVPTEENMEVTYMHLTNYSLNKMSESFDSRTDNGTKRPMSEIYDFMQNKGYNVKKLIADIDEIIVKTIVGVAPSLRHSYRATHPKREKGCCCFEILGFDILVDRDLNPFLLEVNHSPSFNLDTNVDSQVKFQVVRDVFTILFHGQESSNGKDNLSKYNIERQPGTNRATVIPDALKDQFAHEENSDHCWRLIFSEENPGKYAKFMDQEYNAKDYNNDLFLKKKLVPCMHDGRSQSFFKSGSAQEQTSLRKTSFGQVYVESRTPTPPHYSYNEFLKFKYNAQLTEAAQSAKRLNKSGRYRRNSFVLPLQSISDEAKVNNNQIEVWRSVDNDSRSGSSGSDSPLPKLKFQVVSPSQRVQNTLELLRKSNIEKFKAAVNYDMMSRYCVESQAKKDPKDISPYLAAQSCTALCDNNVRSSATKMNFTRPTTSTTSKVVRHNKNGDVVSFLTYAKLPSVIKHAMNATPLQREETTRVATATSSARYGKELTPSGRNILIGNSRHFKPLQKEINEELDKLQKLPTAKSKVEILGVGATAQKVVDIVSAKANPNRKKIPDKNINTSWD